MAVTADVSRVVVEAEMLAADCCVRRHNWQCAWAREELRLTASMRSRVDQELYVLEFRLEDYREKPPLIEFISPDGQERGTARCYPSGGRGYFHPAPVICAPWNRKAYAEHGGPHGDWAMSGWAGQRPNHSRLGDMLSLIQELLDDKSSYGGRMRR